LFKDVVKKRLKKRAEALEFLVKFYQIYNQVAISWIRRAIKRPLLSMYGIDSVSNQTDGGEGAVLATEGDENGVTDLSKQSLKFFSSNLSKRNPEEFQKRMMLLRVRVKGIITNLLESTTLDSIPGPLIIFISNLTKDGQYVPDNFLTPYELNRIDLDNYSAIVDLDQVQRQMIAAIYLFGKMLVSKVLLVPEKASSSSDEKNEKKDEIQIYLDQQQELDSVVKENFKIVASVLYLMFMQEIQATMKNYERHRDKPGNDIISRKLYTYKQIS